MTQRLEIIINDQRFDFSRLLNEPSVHNAMRQRLGETFEQWSQRVARIGAMAALIAEWTGRQTAWLNQDRDVCTDCTRLAVKIYNLGDRA